MSLVVSELIELQTNDSSCVVRLEQIEKFRDGSGYVCEMTVRSDWLSLSRKFYFDDVSLSVAVPALRVMATGAEGTCKIKGQWEEDYLQIDSNVMGHVQVSGEVIEHSEFDQRVRFAFRTDQTILSPLANGLQVLQDA